MTRVDDLRKRTGSLAVDVKVAKSMGAEFEEEIIMEETKSDVNFTDSDLVYHVRNALISACSGDSESYQQLVGVLHHNQRLTSDEVALLVTSLKALSGAVSYIDCINHESLLNTIFGMTMWHYGLDVIDAVLELIVSLAASNGKYVDSCLDMLVSNFVPPIYMVDMLTQPRGQAKKEQVFSRVHSALESISELVPMAATRLSSIIIHRMPMLFKRDLGKQRAKDQAQLYVENMLRLESGSMKEIVGGRILMAVVDMLIDLDVIIGWEDILKDDTCKGVFAIEVEDEFEIDYENEIEDNCDEELPGTLSQKYIGKNAVADILDNLMVCTCEHLELCMTNRRLSEVFEILLDSFMTTILHTYKSKFAQFVLFYACALDPDRCGVTFAKKLSDIFLSGLQPLTRMSAAAYLASYLARAKFVPPIFVTNILKSLVDWCLEYSKVDTADLNPKLHRVYYSGCQAIMYILCFRLRSIIEVPRIRTQLFQMPIEEILNNRLEPLKVCLPSIVEEFLKQAKAAHLFTSKTFVFDDLLELDLSKEFGGVERLDMFFPFDPCLLKKCDRNFIRPNFIYWKNVRTTYEDDVDSSDEDAAEGTMDINQNTYDEQFDNALSNMSITPKGSFSSRFSGQKMRMPSRIRPSASPESPLMATYFSQLDS